MLVVDDDAMILRSYRRVLEPYFDLVMVESGRRAIEILTEDPAFDVILCDLAMPDPDGTAVYRALEQIAPERCERIIFCTGGVQPEHGHVEFLAPLSNPQVVKPVPPRELRWLIADHRDRFS